MRKGDVSWPRLAIGIAEVLLALWASAGYLGRRVILLAVGVGATVVARA